MATDLCLDLGAALRSLRRQQDLSQRELARRAATPTSTVARIESGEITNPSLRTVERLARAAGATLAIRATERAAPSRHPAPPAASETRRDAAGRRYPAHLDIRVTYPFFTRDHRLQRPGTPQYTYELDRAARDARRQREAVAASLPIERADDHSGELWQWLAQAPDGSVAGRLVAKRYPCEQTSAFPAPETVLCELNVTPRWQPLGLGQRLLARLRAEVAGLGPVEIVTLTHPGPPATYLRELGFHHPVRTVVMLKCR